MSWLRLIDAEGVHEGLPWAELIDALRRGHEGDRPATGRLLMGMDDDGYLLLPGWSRGGVIGTKLVTIFPGNLGQGIDSLQALYTVFDGTDGTPEAVIDGTALTYRKTAADSALGSTLLARTDMDVMTIVGAGGLAPYIVNAQRSAHPSISRVLVWNRTRSRAEAMAASIDEAEVVDDLEAAVRQSDLISCATMSTEPLVLGEWLRDGAHVDLVGAYQPHMRESDDEVMRRGRIFVDNHESTTEEAGDLLSPIANGAIVREDILGDLFDLVQGRIEGRTSADDITVFKNGGGAHLDLMAAALLLESS